MPTRQLVIVILIALSLIGCTSVTTYEFPESIDPSQRYLFYLHGKIIEDQGLPAISPDYGEYEYEAILDALAGNDFVVISEQRPKDTNSFAYAKKVREQIQTLLEAGVPVGNITVVGASKGAAITVLVSYLLKNDGMNFVLLGSCHPDTVDEFCKDKSVWLAMCFLFTTLLTGGLAPVGNFSPSLNLPTPMRLFWRLALVTAFCISL